MKVYDSVDGEVCDESRLSKSRFVRKFYDRLRVFSVPVGESLASQDAKDASDINFLMARFARAGEIPPASKPALFQDNTVVPDNLGDAIMMSRSTLSTASANLEASQKEAERIKAESLAKDLAELDALRKASATPPAST